MLLISFTVAAYPKLRILKTSETIEISILFVTKTARLAEMTDIVERWAFELELTVESKNKLF